MEVPNCWREIRCVEIKHPFGLAIFLDAWYINIRKQKLKGVPRKSGAIFSRETAPPLSSILVHMVLPFD